MVEADLEIGFSLIDILESFPAETARLVADAEQVYAGLLTRLNHFTPPQRENFEPLVNELRRAIDLRAPPQSEPRL
jgi:hypothetical protein